MCVNSLSALQLKKLDEICLISERRTMHYLISILWLYTVHDISVSANSDNEEIDLSSMEPMDMTDDQHQSPDVSMPLMQVEMFEKNSLHKTF